MKEETLTKTNKIIIWIFLLFMPMSTYTTPIEGITLGDIILALDIILCVIILVKNRIKLIQFANWPIAVYILMIIFNSLIIWILEGTNIKSSILSILRYLMYMISVLVIPRYFLKNKYTYKIYKGLSMAFAIYCIIQFISYIFFKKVLPINVLGLPTHNYIDELRSDRFIQLYNNGSVMFRTYSVFLEPSYYAIYQIPILYIILNKTNEKRKYLMAFIITVTLFMASTTTGIILSVICWWKTIYKLILKNISKFVALLLISIIPIIILLNTSFMKNVLNRIITDNGELGSSVVGRIENFDNIFNEDTKLRELLIGKGMWVETDYLPSYGRLLVSFGMIGTAIFILLMFYTYINSNKLGKVFVLLLSIVCIGTNTVFNISCVLIFSMIYLNYKKEEKNKNENL